MPKLCLKRKGTVKLMEWVESIDRKGKVCWVERPLKPSPGTLRMPHGTPMPSGTPMPLEETHQARGAIGSNGEDFGGSHDHLMGHGAPWKTKVSTFAD